VTQHNPPPSGPVRVCIGVFAHNEERCIEATLRSIAAQSVWKAGWAVSVLVLVNGSSDQTAPIAERVARELAAAGPFSAEVCVLAEGGKSRTWNTYVHTLAPPDTDFLFFTDADIQLPDPTTFVDIIRFLQATPVAAICTSRPTKEVELRPARSLFEWATKRISEIAQNPVASRRGVSGSLYCLRGHEARAIALPVGLLGEDGYVRTAVSTRGFRAPPDDTRLDRCPTARHVFSQVASLGEFFTHERRLMMGTLQNRALWKIVEQRPADTDPSQFVFRLNAAQPGWARQALIDSRKGASVLELIRETGAIPLGQLRFHPLLRRLALFPVALARATLCVPVCISAERAIRQGRISW
jgi:hypothetical protein